MSFVKVTTRGSVGDKARFLFSSGKEITGEIIELPLAVGDYWIIREVCEGRKWGIVHIGQFDAMYLIEDKEGI
jgi:hypothetical protein